MQTVSGLRPLGSAEYNMPWINVPVDEFVAQVQRHRPDI